MRFPAPSCTEAGTTNVPIPTWNPWPPVAQNGWVHDAEISCVDRFRQILAKIPAITKHRLSETNSSFSTQLQNFGGDYLIICNYA